MDKKPCRYLDASIWSGFSFYCHKKRCFCTGKNEPIQSCWDMNYRKCEIYNADILEG